MFLVTSFLSHTWIKAGVGGNSCIMFFPNKMGRPAQIAHVFASFTPLFSLEEKGSCLVKKCSWGNGMLPPFLVLSSKGCWLGRHEPSYEEGIVAGKGSFSAAPPIPLAAAVAASKSLGWQQQSCRFLVCWAKRKTFSQATVNVADQWEVFQTHSQWVYLCCGCWDGLVSIRHSWVLYLAPILSLERLSTGNLKIPSYNRNVSEFLREPWGL